jgi:hypothetical protein
MLFGLFIFQFPFANGHFSLPKNRRFPQAMANSKSKKENGK